MSISTTTSTETAQQPPPLPKIKLKISSNEPAKQVKPAASIAVEQPSPNVVKPLKINLGKPKAQTTPLPVVTQMSESADVKSLVGGKDFDEDEIELGEVVKPKSTPPPPLPSSKMNTSSSSSHPPVERISPMQQLAKLPNQAGVLSGQTSKPKQ